MQSVFQEPQTTPNQSPLYWVSHKDRYLRQLLIKDIEEITGRSLVVYFTDCDRTLLKLTKVMMLLFTNY